MDSYRCQIGYSSHWNRIRNHNRNWCRFSGNSSAHYHWTQFHRNRSRAVEMHHNTERNETHCPLYYYFLLVALQGSQKLSSMFAAAAVKSIRTHMITTSLLLGVNLFATLCSLGWSSIPSVNVIYSLSHDKEQHSLCHSCTGTVNSPEAS